MHPIIILIITLTAVWRPNTEPDLAGYRLSVGAATGMYNTLIGTADTTVQITDWPDAMPMYAVVQAYDHAGNYSDPSLEAVWIPNPDPIAGDINGDGRINVIDNIEFNRIRQAGLYNPRLDLYPPGAPDGKIDVLDKLEFLRLWRTAEPHN